MSDLRTRLGRIERVSPPDLWADIEARSSAEGHVRRFAPVAGLSPGVRRGAVLLVAAAVFAAAFFFLERVYSAEPTVTPAAPVAPVAFGGWGPAGILFVSDRGGADNVWLIQPDGSGAAALTDNADDRLAYGSSVWSPDGTQIAFSVYSFGEDLYRLYVMRADGSGLSSVGNGAGAVWSPDGSHLAFMVDNEVNTSKRPVVVEDVATSALTVVGKIQGPMRGAQGYPPFPVDANVTWSPDGAAVAVAGDDGALTVSGLDGQSSTLTTGMSSVANPAWSPDGATIAFECWENANANGSVCMIPVSGGEVERLRDGGHPTWSPDGSALAYTTDVEIYSYGLSAMAPDGSRDASLGPLYQATHTWSPDGSMLLVTTDGGFVHGHLDTDLRIYPADGSTPIRLTSGTDLDHAF